MTSLIAVSLLELCRARHIPPFDDVDPTFLLLESLLSTIIPPPFLEPTELSAQDAQKVLDANYKTTILSALPVVVANSFSIVLDNMSNSRNCISQLVKLASLVAEMMLQLDNMMTGNQWAYGLADTCLASMRTLKTEMPDTSWVLIDTIIDKFVEVTHGATDNPIQLV
jgi:hypothetical protein